MSNELQSKQNGEPSLASESTQLGTPSSSGVLTRLPKNPTMSAMSANSPDPKNQIGFQATVPSGLDPKTELAKTLVTLAGNLGETVFWRQIELSNGVKVVALCFPVTTWTPDPDNGFVYKG